MSFSSGEVEAAGEDFSAQLERFGTRFVDADVEARYMAWRVSDSVPLIRLAIYLGTASVLSVPALFVFLDSAYFWEMLPVLFGLVFPLQMGGLLLLRFIPPGRWVFPFIGVLTLVPAAGVVWVTYWVLGEASLSVVTAVICALYAPFIRVPPSMTLFAVLPFVVMADYFLWLEYTSGDLSVVAFWGQLLATTIAFVTVLVVCMVVERLSRLAYCRTRLIADQKQALEASYSLIRRYVPPAVVSHIFDGRSDDIERPQRRRVTVLFSDIVGFTDMADRVEPEVMTEVLSTYLSGMAELIEQHGGTLSEFSGDGLMALFGAPDRMFPEEQANNALATAKAMRSRMVELNERWRKLGLGAEMRVRIGINTGMASVGSFGSQGRMTYTAVGLQVNIASRIESATEPGQVLISDATYQLVGEVYRCEPRGEVDCKGVHFPVKVFAPVFASALPEPDRAAILMPR